MRDLWSQDDSDGHRTSPPGLDIHRIYADGWLPDGGIRVNFVTGVDGAATAGGRARGLQTPGDNRIFAALRDLADVVLVGAGTARAEGYAVVRPGAVAARARARFGMAADLPTAVVSRALRFDPSDGLFDPGGPRTVVLTCRAADAQRRVTLARTADVVVCGDDEVDLALVRDALRDRGFTRILGEGGPTLFSGLAMAGLVDELCLSISPVLTGPGATRMTAGPAWPSGDRRELRLAGLLEEDGALFCRYRSR